MNALKFISGSSYSTVLTIIELITELDWNKMLKIGFQQTANPNL